MNIRFSFLMAVGLLAALPAWAEPDAAAQPEKPAVVAQQQVYGPPNPVDEARFVRAMQRGKASYDRSDYADAEDEFRAALQVLPGSAEALNDLGEAQYRGGKFAEAQQSFEKAVETGDPAVRSRAAYNLGNALFRQYDGKSDDKLKAAADAYKKSLRFDEKDEDARHNLQVVLDKMKQKQNEQKQKDQQQANNDGKGDKNSQQKNQNDKSKSDQQNKKTADNQNQSKNGSDKKQQDKKQQAKSDQQKQQDKQQQAKSDQQKQQDKQQQAKTQQQKQQDKQQQAKSDQQKQQQAKADQQKQQQAKTDQQKAEQQKQQQAKAEQQKGQKPQQVAGKPGQAGMTKEDADRILQYYRDKERQGKTKPTPVAPYQPQGGAETW